MDVKRVDENKDEANNANSVKSGENKKTESEVTGEYVKIYENKHEKNSFTMEIENTTKVDKEDKYYAGNASVTEHENNQEENNEFAVTNENNQGERTVDKEIWKVSEHEHEESDVSNEFMYDYIDYIDSPENELQGDLEDKNTRVINVQVPNTEDKTEDECNAEIEDETGYRANLKAKEEKRDDNNVKSHSYYNKNCYVSTIDYQITGKFVMFPPLDPISEDVELNKSDAWFSVDKTENQDKNFKLDNFDLEFDFSADDKSANKYANAQCRLKHKHKKKSRVKCHDIESGEDVITNTGNKLEDKIKKSILDLLDVYESNPGLQKVKKKDIRTNGNRKHHSRKNDQMSLTTGRETVRVRPKQNVLKPLPPTISPISETALTPRYFIKRRIKLEQEIQDNLEKMKAMELAKFKFINSTDRFNKSEFGLMKAFCPSETDNNSAERSRSVSMTSKSSQDAGRKDNDQVVDRNSADYLRKGNLTILQPLELDRPNIEMSQVINHFFFRYGIYPIIQHLDTDQSVQLESLFRFGSFFS